MSVELLKRLRDETQYSLQACKKALEQSSYDYEKALALVKELAREGAAKKADRATKEGLVGLHVCDGVAILAELNCETDFVSRGERFVNVLQKMLDMAAALYGSYNNRDDFLDTPLADGSTPGTVLRDEMGVLGENIVLSKLHCINTKDHVVAYYIHNPLQAAPSLGRIASLVILNYSGQNVQAVVNCGKSVALQIASDAPLYLSRDTASDVIAAKRAEYTVQAVSAGKPAAVVEKITEGAINKFAAETVLLEQPFILDDSKSMNDLLKDLAKELGEEVSIVSFARLALGEDLLHA